MIRRFIVNLIFTEFEKRIIFFALRNYGHPCDHKNTKKAIDELEDVFIDEI